MYIERDEAAYRCLAHVEETWSLHVFAECRNAFAQRGVAEGRSEERVGTKQRARKEESYLEDEYLRARRKNLRSPWPAAAIEGIGAGEQRRLSQRKDTGRSALPGAAAARWPPSASHLRLHGGTKWLVPP